jgi:CubicO group peptidase (beta-lactamase class C family)
VKFFLRLHALGSILASAALSVSGLPAHATDPGPLAPVLQPLVDKKLVAGIVVAVANGEKIVDEESAGWRSLERQTPMTKDSVFWIASMTKSFTAAAVMMLADEGKLNVNDPVEEYLPEFKGQMVAGEDGKETPHPPKHPITISDILSHTSGLITPQDKALHPSATLQEEVAQYGARPLLREPGAKYQYNNVGINTAGRIVEVVSGMPYPDFIQKRLLDPLEMKDTSFWPNEAEGARLASSYRRAADGQGLDENHFDRNVKPELIARLSKGATVPAPVIADFGLSQVTAYANNYAMPAGGLYSTAADVAHFGEMLLNRGTYHGKRLLSEAAVKEMTTSRTAGLTVSPPEAYGLALSLKTREDDGLPPGSFGHRGARRTAFWVDPTDHLVMVVMVSRMDMPGNEQKEMYGSFLKAAVEKFGRKQP